MIRFRCPGCGREYLLADALAHLPLVCKGCGQSLAVPDAQADPPDPPPAPPPKPDVAWVPPPAVPALDPPPPARDRKWLAYAVDAAVVVVLLAVGALVGEVIARKPTAAIFADAGTAPKFPPTDLLIWLGCAAVFPLVYAWLGTRGRTVGGWLKRRAA